MNAAFFRAVEIVVILNLNNAFIEIIIESREFISNNNLLLLLLLPLKIP